MILDREPAFDDLEKRWIVNRIVDPEYEAMIIQLLEKYLQKYQVIRFDRKKFQEIPKGDFQERLDEMIGINRARNMALREGKCDGQWVLVFDGNCFFSAQAWEKVRKACLMNREIKYIVVPMIRILKEDKSVPAEPQIIFRNDSKEEFDEAYGYGQDSKVNLLRRLGVRGEWDQREEHFKKDTMMSRLKETVFFVTAGYVWRLPSDNETADRDIMRRKEYRDRGIRLLMAKIDKG